MKKSLIILLVLALGGSSILNAAKIIQITRDKTQLKDGPGNFYDTIAILKAGTTMQFIKKSEEDPGWIQVGFNKSNGYISELSLKEKPSSNSLSKMDLSDVDIKTKSQIAPASYTAAIKGFALDYSKKKKYTVNNIDDLMAITDFTKSDFFKVRTETKLAFFPKRGELIGLGDTYISQNLSSLGLAASMDVFQQGVVFDKAMTKRLNVIANILNRQTCDYDVRYYVWVVKNAEPVAFSGPGGYIFISDALVKMLNDYRELVAVIAHEIGHIALRHGIRDLAVEQSRASAKDAFNELDMDLDDESLAVSDDLESDIDLAIKACALVRDDKEEYEADSVSRDLLIRYKIDPAFLTKTLSKVNLALGSKYPRYKTQMQLRIDKLNAK